MKQEKGFTIIELLVAMAILGLLIGLMIPGVGIVRRNARDTARKTSLQSVQSMLEDYYGSYGYYPTDLHGSLSTDSDTLHIEASDVNNNGAFSNCSYAEAAVSSTRTCDVDETMFYVVYELTDNKQDYKLGVCLESDDFYIIKE